MKLDNVSTTNLLNELSRRRIVIQRIEVFDNVGYKIRTPFDIIKKKGPVTIIIIKRE